MSSSDSTPIIYGAPWCVYCVSLMKKLDALGVVYTYRNVEEGDYEQEMLDKTNGKYLLPTVDIVGTIMQNPSIKDIRTELGV